MYRRFSCFATTLKPEMFMPGDQNDKIFPDCAMSVDCTRVDAGVCSSGDNLGRQPVTGCGFFLQPGQLEQQSVPERAGWIDHQRRAAQPVGLPEQQPAVV